MERGTKAKGTQGRNLRARSGLQSGTVRTDTRHAPRPYTYEIAREIVQHTCTRGYSHKAAKA